MKKLIPILTTALLISCNNSKINEYQQSICSVDKNGFLYKSESKNNKSHNIKIKGGSAYFNSNLFGKFTNSLEKSTIFTYSGTKDNGLFSYRDKNMNAPHELGIIHYFCWRELKKRYSKKSTFNEIIK